MKIVLKKVFVMLSFIIVLTIMGSSHATQADPALVTDCMGENADSKECKEESEEQEKVPEKEENPVADKDTTGSLILSFIKTGFVLLLILFLIYFLLKFLNKRNKLYNQVKTLENLGGISVGQNKSIQIVRVGTKVYMIGVGENVELLEEINDEDVITDLLDHQKSSDLKGNHVITSLFNLNRSKNDSTTEETDHHFKEMFSNELDKLKENRLKIKKQQKEKDG